MPRQIQGSQNDFSFGEIDIDLKRSDSHPARKGGLRQMANARIHNSGTIQNRSGRRALYSNSTGCTRIEEVTMSAGNIFKLAFGPARVEVRDSTGTLVVGLTTQGNGETLPWDATNLENIVYAVVGLSIYITFTGMRPQVLTWDGVSTWVRIDYNELLIGNQKRTPFYRISPQGIALTPSATTGVGITVLASQSLFTSAWVGTRIRFVGRQILITAFIDTTRVTATVEEPLPGGQTIVFLVDPATVFSVGDAVLGSVTGSKGVITQVNSGTKEIGVQLLTQNATTVTSVDYSGTYTSTFAFTLSDTVVGPGGALVPSSVTSTLSPKPCTVWDEECINAFRGYPASCFTDQFRLGFCNFPAIPGGISWSAINSPTDLYVGTNPGSAIFEIAPGKVQVYYVVPGPESSEFVFCDRRIYYIPISPTNPLKPGSVAFQVLSGDGSARVQPRISQEAIIYVNAGGNSPMAIVASGAYYRPFNTKELSQFHNHLFNNIVAIAAPDADNSFNERYAYVLNGDGTIAVGKYEPKSLLSDSIPVIGWGPWSGGGVVNWIAAHDSDVIFTSSYFGIGICEILDDAQYMDCAFLVNSPPAALVPPGGKGPLWFIPSQSVWLMDQVTRNMGTYQIDANGFIIPQFNGGEDLTAVSLVAGQPWTMTAEPFAPDAQSGADVGQRMKKRQYSYFAVYVVNSSGFKFATLFSSQQLPASPALGAIVGTREVPAYNFGDNAILPPTLRETVETYAPTGSSFDPRACIIKDTPGPLLICEFAMEVTI